MSSRGLTTFLGVLAAVMIWGAPAQAKIIGSGFDPNIFSGNGTFFVPDSCLTLNTGFHALPGSCSGVLLESASLTAKDTDTTGLIVLGTVDLSLKAPDTGSDVTGMVLNSHANPVVVGFNTIEIPMTVDGCTGNLCGFSWLLEWVSGLPVDEEYDWQNPLDGLNNHVNLFESGSLFGTASKVTFTNGAVPEPGSLGLLLGALGAGWLARRRKAAA